MPNDFFELPGSAAGFLDYPILWEEFAAFVRKAGDPESIEFLEAYDNRLDPQKMYMNFVAEGAPRQINVPGPQRTAVRNLVQDGQTHAYEDIFDDCRRTILNVIEGDFGTRFRNDPKNYPRFLKAEFGGEVLAALAPDQARALSEDQLTDLLAAALPALTTPKPDDATSDAEKRSYDKKLSVMWNALLKSDVPPAFDPTSFVNVAAASMTAEATKERKLRRAIGVPDDASDLYNEYRSLEKAGPAADPTAETQRTERMSTVAAMLNGKTNNEGSGKLYALTQIEESLAVAKAAKDRADALEQTRRPGAPITEAEIAPQRELEAAEVRARGFAEGAGMSPEMAENFFTAFTDGNEDYADSLNPPSTILHRDDAQKQAYGEQYSADVQLMPALERLELNLKKILRDPSIERIKQQWLVADANARPGLKDQAIALGEQIGLTMIPPRPIHPADIEAFFQGEISTDEPTPAETPDAANPTGEGVDANTETNAEDARKTVLERINANTDMQGYRTEFSYADEVKRPAFIKDALELAINISRELNLGYIATQADVETFLNAEPPAPEQTAPEAQPTRADVLAAIFADSSLMDWKQDWEKAADDRKPGLVKDALAGAIALGNAKNFTYVPTQADVQEFFATGTAPTENAAQPDQGFPEMPPLSLADLLKAPQMVQRAADFATLTDQGAKKAALKAAIIQLEFEAAENNLDVKILPKDVLAVLAGAPPTPSKLADLLAKAEMRDLAVQYQATTDPATHETIFKKAIDSLQFDIDIDGLGINIDHDTVRAFLRGNATAAAGSDAPDEGTPPPPPGNEDQDGANGAAGGTSNDDGAPPMPPRPSPTNQLQQLRDVYQNEQDEGRRKELLTHALQIATTLAEQQGSGNMPTRETIEKFLSGGAKKTEDKAPNSEGVQGLYKDALEEMANLIGNGELAQVKDYASNMAKLTANDPTAMNGADAAGILKMAQEVYDRRPKTGEGSGPVLSSKVQDLLTLIAEQLREKNGNGARKMAVELADLVRGTSSPIAGKTAEDILKMIMTKQRQDDKAKAAASDQPEELHPNPPKLASTDAPTADDQEYLNGADADGIMAMAQEMPDGPPKSDEGAAPALSGNVKDALAGIADHIRGHHFKGARTLATSLVEMVSGTSSPLAGKSADEILQMVRVKVNNETPQAPKGDDSSTEARLDTNTAMDGAEEDYGPLKLGVLKTFKWARFKMLYKVKIDKKAEGEFDARIVEFSKMLIKKQKSPKIMFKPGIELMDWVAENKGSMFFGDNKHLIAGLLTALTEFQENGTMSSKITKSQAKDILGGEQIAA